jgi:hypothetical protein
MLPDMGWAVVVSTTQGNTTFPTDDPGWNNVGVLNRSSAVYLGDRWVLTAAHVGVGTVTFSGLGSFAAAPETRIALTNPIGSGLTKPTDLILFQLTEDPGLPPVRVARQTPATGDEVVAIGNGLARQDETAQWNVRQQGSEWTWTETVGQGDYQGFHAVGPSIMRWGTNLIEDDETFNNDFDDDILYKLRLTDSDTLTIVTEFDHDDSVSDSDVRTSDGSTATAFESQAVLNDSGGGLFRKRGSTWELVGTMLAVEGHANQPDPTRTPMYGNSTYYADLASYVDQIEQRTVFGDFDGNRDLTDADIDTLSRAVTLQLSDARFDLDHDGSVTFADHRIWVEEVAFTYYGDANLDGSFGTSDLIAVLQQGHYEDLVVGNSGWRTGDWNGDREFSTSDFVLALQSGGFELGPRQHVPNVATVAAVPEPSAAILVLTALAGGLYFIRVPGRRCG